MHLREDAGLEEVHVGPSGQVGTDTTVWLEQLERFAKEVMPAFKSVSSTEREDGRVGDSHEIGQSVTAGAVTSSG